jgi:hypothetical protein
VTCIWKYPVGKPGMAYAEDSSSPSIRTPGQVVQSVLKQVTTASSHEFTNSLLLIIPQVHFGKYNLSSRYNTLNRRNITNVFNFQKLKQNKELEEKENPKRTSRSSYHE